MHLKLIQLIIILVFFFYSGFSQDLRSKIGQMIMVGFYPNTNFEDTLFIDLNQRNLGGVILFANNINDPQQVRSLTNQLQTYSSAPLFIATDQEGGYVARFNANNGFENTHSHYTLGTIFNSEDSTRNTASKMSQWLFDSGININLAPVVDVNVNPMSPAIGLLNRSFSNDPMIVFNHSSWFIDEFAQKYVISSLKHYPGHGSAIDDSHLGFTDITNTWSESELIPYEHLIASGYTDLIMAGHLYNANIDSLHPASLSYSTITTLLKDSLGFNGLVISDELFMGAIRNNYTFEEAIELAINAGTDILLYRTNERNNGSLVRQIIDVVEQKVNIGLIAQNRIDDAYQKIVNLKQRLTSIDFSYALNNLPSKIKISNYPNPFNSNTTILFKNLQNGKLEVKIFNVLGQIVWHNSIFITSIPEYSLNFNASNLTSGIYFVQTTDNQRSVVKKITCLK